MSRPLQIAAWVGTGLVGLVAVLVFGAGAAALPDGSVVCLTRRTLSLPCPGCGMTRSVVALLQGNLVESFRLHPLGPILTIESFLGWTVWGVWLVGRLAPPPFTWVRALLLGHVAVLVSLWLGRLAVGTLPA